MAKILSVGPSVEYLVARNRALMQQGHQVRGADTRVKALAFAKSHSFDLIVLCDQFPAAYAAEMADELKALSPATPIVVLNSPQPRIAPEEIEAVIGNAERESRAA